MLLSGLWHGANITFVVWGALHALYRSIEIVFSWPQRFLTSRTGNAIACILVFLQVIVAWVFFRAETLTRAVAILKRLFVYSEGSAGDIGIKVFVILTFMIMLEVSVALKLRFDGYFRPFIYQRLEFAGAVCMGVLGVFFRGPGSKFIYFQF